MLAALFVRFTKSKDAPFLAWTALFGHSWRDALCSWSSDELF